MNSNKDEIYGKAFVEVEAAIDCLCIEDYEKIPKAVIDVIAESKDENYIYEYDKDLDYEDWVFMPESKGLLYNIFKRYLATDEQRNFLINKERIEKWKLEEEKKRNYSSNNIFKKEEVQVDKIKEKQKSESDIKDLVEYKDSFIKRIFNKIASFFKK